MERRDKWQLAAAAVLAAFGTALAAVRPLGMRFSGFLLLALAGAVAVWVLLRRLSRRSGIGRWLYRLFCWGAVLGLVCLVGAEVCIINIGRSDLSALPADAVVVLGAGVNGKAPSLSLRTRLDAALAYLERNPDVPVVLTGGQGYGEEISEAQCMYDYLTARGVAPGRLILEEQAANTEENLAFSAPLLEEQGIDLGSDRVAIVTNDFHVARARLLAARQGYGHAFGISARLPWVHLEVNYYLREAFAIGKTILLS